MKSITMNPVTKNVMLLALCQGIAMTSITILDTVAALIGNALASDKSLATRNGRRGVRRTRDLATRLLAILSGDRFIGHPHWFCWILSVCRSRCCQRGISCPGSFASRQWRNRRCFGRTRAGKLGKRFVSLDTICGFPVAHCGVTDSGTSPVTGGEYFPPTGNDPVREGAITSRHYAATCIPGGSLREHGGLWNDGSVDECNSIGIRGNL